MHINTFFNLPRSAFYGNLFSLVFAHIENKMDLIYLLYTQCWLDLVFKCEMKKKKNEVTTKSGLDALNLQIFPSLFLVLYEFLNW